LILAVRWGHGREDSPGFTSAFKLPDIVRIDGPSEPVCDEEDVLLDQGPFAEYHQSSSGTQESPKMEVSRKRGKMVTWARKFMEAFFVEVGRTCRIKCGFARGRPGWSGVGRTSPSRRSGVGRTLSPVKLRIYIGLVKIVHVKCWYCLLH